MAVTLAFIHTGHVLIPVFSKLAREILPGIETFHMLDESLIRATIAAGALTEVTTRRVISMIGLAHEGGADAVMVTCSSIGPAAAAARSVFPFPVLRVDEAMADAAVKIGGRIGVAATLRTTLEPTIALLEETAGAAGRSIEVVPALCEGAFRAVITGNTERHDCLLCESLQELVKGVDVVVLAQASMARVVHCMDVRSGPPILSSPELAVRRAQELLMREPAAVR